MHSPKSALMLPWFFVCLLWWMWLVYLVCEAWLGLLLLCNIETCHMFARCIWFVFGLSLGFLVFQPFRWWLHILEDCILMERAVFVSDLDGSICQVHFWCILACLVQQYGLGNFILGEYHKNALSPAFCDFICLL